MTIKKPRTVSRRYLRQEEADKILLEFEEDMRLGAPDEEIAEATGLSPRRVADYRRKHVVKRTRVSGHSKSELHALYQDALQLLDPEGELDPLLVPTESKVLKHRWEPPAFVYRTPLNYDALGMVLYRMRNDYGMSYTDLAGAVGIEEEDVLACLELYAAFLAKWGSPCPSCRNKRHIIDPYQQEKCSACVQEMSNA